MKRLIFVLVMSLISINVSAQLNKPFAEFKVNNEVFNKSIHNDNPLFRYNEKKNLYISFENCAIKKIIFTLENGEKIILKSPKKTIHVSHYINNPLFSNIPENIKSINGEIHFVLNNKIIEILKNNKIISMETICISNIGNEKYNTEIEVNGIIGILDYLYEEELNNHR